MVNFTILIFAYLLGSIPTALLISKNFFNIDIREHGSKNIGATNTLRVLGFIPSIFVLAFDALKSFIPVYFSHNHLHDPSLAVLTAIATILGHVFPIFLNFKGGKGVATILGACCGIWTHFIIIYLSIFFCILLLSKYVSLSSILTIILFSITLFNETNFLPYKVFSIFISILILFTHRHNIQRIIKGTERKI